MADGTLAADSRHRIGLVEDEPDMAMLLSYNLECLGYLVDVMHRGDEAATMLRSQRFDLIILDWMVPGLSGIELLQRLRDTPVTRGTPVIMLTARTTELDIIRALDTGADDFVAKPFSIANLLQRVTAILERNVRSRSVRSSAPVASASTLHRERLRPVERRSSCPLRKATCLSSFCGIRIPS